MKLLAVGLAVTALIPLAPMPAQAQSETFKDNVTKLIRKVGVQANLSLRKPVDSDVSKDRTLGLSIGFSPGRTNGWRYPFSLTSFSENLHSPNGERFAVLRSRAILGGIGYGRQFGRWSTGLSLQAGYAFNSGRIDGDMLRAFGSPHESVSVDVGNAVIVRPQVKAEYFVTPKFTLRVSGDYVMMRPGITVAAPGQRLVDRWDASNFHANIGVGFYPFRK